MGETLPSKPRSLAVRPIHRIIGTVIMLFTLYVGATGVMIQSVDLKAILSHAAATDPEMMAIRESIDGTPNYIVIGPSDFAAAVLPEGYDFEAALSTVLKSTRTSVGADVPVKYVELRVVNGKPVGIVEGGQMIRVDPASGALLPSPVQRTRVEGGQGGTRAGAAQGRAAQGGARGAPRVQSKHQVFKNWHRVGILSDKWEFLNGLVGMALFTMIVTGLVLYFQLLRTRKRAGLNAIFWSSGGWWRSLHRGVSIVAAVFLLVVSFSGTMLSFDTFALGIYGMTHASAGRFARFPQGMTGDLSSPLPDEKLPAMLRTTLSAFHSAEGSTPIKVLRLRYFSGMPQGVIIAAGKTDDETHQIVYNAETGGTAHMTESSYPYQGFPFGWREHEYMKQIHRGDALGIPGRLMDLSAGLSLVFLSASGLVMYVDLLRRRRKGGRKEFFWA